MRPGSKPRPDLDPLSLECTHSVAPRLSTAFYKDLFPALLLGMRLQPGLPEPVTLADLAIPNPLSWCSAYSVPAQRHSTGQREDSTGNTGAVGEGVADVREYVSFKGGFRTKSRRTGYLPEHFCCRRTVGKDNWGIARRREPAPYLKNVDSGAFEREGSG